MPPPYRHHVLICTNRRPEGSPKGCCASKGSEELVQAFKEAVTQAGLRGIVRAQGTGCHDACERGPTVAVYGEGNPATGCWYGGVKREDIAEIVHAHLQEGQPVERLRMAPYPAKKA